VEPGRHSAAEDDKKVSVQQPVAQPVDSWMNVMPGSVNPATAAQWQAGVRLDSGHSRPRHMQIFLKQKKKLNSLGIELERGGDYADVQWQINGLVDHIIRGVLGWACVEDGRTDRFR